MNDWYILYEYNGNDSRINCENNTGLRNKTSYYITKPNFADLKYFGIWHIGKKGLYSNFSNTY